MTTTLEYALLAGDAYYSTRAEVNRFPTPEGWSEDTNQRRADGQTGFEARTFQSGTEVVISYAGTYAKDIGGDVQADINLAAGVYNAQLLQAATYYLNIKASHPNVTLTGHSLGGGLASLIAVFFGENATTFDQAPFANAARTFNDRDVADTLKSQLLGLGFTETALAGLTSFITQRQSSGSAIPNADKVRNIIVAGEMLSLPGLPGDRIGQTAASDTISNTATGASSGDLHAQALLTAFLLGGNDAIDLVAINVHPVCRNGLFSCENMRAKAMLAYFSRPKHRKTFQTANAYSTRLAGHKGLGRRMDAAGGTLACLAANARNSARSVA